MSYLGFARKYRPKSFSDVVGQRQIATTLQNAIQMERVHHAYLFSGSKGVGKTSMARIFAKALNCEKGSSITPCNKCELCLRIGSGDDVDVVEIDGASNRGIEEIRNIKENVKYLTSRARFKIFIIDEVHMLTTPAFNALLKTLEEPPPHVKFILATTEIASIPDTILSRCQRFNFKKIGIDDIVQQLQKIVDGENIETEAQILPMIAHACGGAMRDSVVLLDQLTAYANGKLSRDVLESVVGGIGQEGEKIVEAIRNKDASQILTIVKNFLDQGGNPSHLLEKLLQLFRDILVITSTNSMDFIEGSEQYCRWIAEQAQHFSSDFATMAIHYLLEGKQLIHRSLMGRIVLEMMLLKTLRIDSVVSLKQIEKSLSILENKMTQRLPSLGSHKREPEREPATSPNIPSSVLVGLQSPAAAPEASVPPWLENTTPVAINSLKTDADLPEAKSPVEEAPAAQPTADAQVGTSPPAEVTAVPESSAIEERSVADSSDPDTCWQLFLNALRQKFPQAAELLRSEANFSLDPRELTLTIPRGYHFISHLLNAQEHKAFINEQLEKAFSQKLSLQFAFGDEKKTQHREQKTLQEQVQADPLVRKSLELFEGRVLEVQTRKGR